MTAVAEGAPRESLMIPPTIVPPLVRHIGRIAQELGVSRAVVEVFGDANISFEVEGDAFPNADDRGVLIASDHQYTVEPWLSQGLMGVHDRNASHVIGKPSSLQCRLIHHISAPEEDLILPVIPGTFAAEKKGKEMINTDLVARLRHPSLVRPRHELNAINAAAMERATQVVENGKALTIYPTGTTQDAAVAPWRRGLGTIVQGLSSEAHDNIGVVVLRPEHLSKGKMITALSLRHLGIRPRPQTIVLRAVNLGTPRELFGDDLVAGDKQAAQRMTDTVRKHFLGKLVGQL